MLSDALQKILDGISIKCFSKSPTNLQQWAYYANSHKGVCIGFSFKNAVIYQDERGRKTKAEIAPVRYQLEYPAIDADGDFGSSEWWRDAVFVKHCDWAHEAEWRIARHVACGWQSLTDECVQRIVLGYRMSPECRQQILGFIREHAPKVEVVTTKLRSYEFAMDLVPL